jgi:hypothetical protein
MGAPVGSLPTRDAAPTAPPGMGSQPGGMDRLLGAEPKPSTDMQQQLESATRRFRDVMTELTSLASTFPGSAKEFRAANEALQRAILQVTQEITRQVPNPRGVGVAA